MTVPQDNRMILKGPGPDELLELGQGISPALAVYLRAARLKRLFRQGWLKRGVPEPSCESVAEHSFGLALLVLLLAQGKPGIDGERAALMALCHELGEAFAGDITPVDGISKEEKAALESESLDRVLEGYPEAEYFRGLWEEYEAAASPEARFVKELDRLEMGIQAALYRAEGSTRMEEFFESARKALSSPELAVLLEAAIEASAG